VRAVISGMACAYPLRPSRRTRRSNRGSTASARATRVLLTAGAQHAMEVTFATIARRGDLVLTEELTYSGMKALSNHLGFHVRGLPMDADGLRPDAVEDACRAGASALYTMPTLQNPTGTIMCEGRRREVAAIAARHDVAIVEDDRYGFYATNSDVPPLASMASGPSYFISRVSKSLVPGVRIGYLLVPAGMGARVNAAIFASTVMASPHLRRRQVTDWRFSPDEGARLRVRASRVGAAE